MIHFFLDGTKKGLNLTILWIHIANFECIEPQFLVLNNFLLYGVNKINSMHCKKYFLGWSGHDLTVVWIHIQILNALNPNLSCWTNFFMERFCIYTIAHNFLNTFHFLHKGANSFCLSIAWNSKTILALKCTITTPGALLEPSYVCCSHFKEKIISPLIYLWVPLAVNEQLHTKMAGQPLFFLTPS